MLGRQSLSQRLSHDPLQLPEVGDVQGQQVVLDDSSELRLIPAHDGEIIIVYEYAAVYRLAVAHVGVAVLFDDFGGNP